MKDVELKLILELMKNSRRSDRELARAIGVSQPTVTRTRGKLEKEGLVREYTIIPDFRKLGYSLVAVTLGNLKEEFRAPGKLEEARNTFKQSFEEGPFDIILSERGLGMRYDGIVVSFHRDYAEYAEFKKWMQQMPFIDSSRLDSFLIDLNDKIHYRYLTFSYLGRNIPKFSKKR